MFLENMEVEVDTIVRQITDVCVCNLTMLFLIIMDVPSRISQVEGAYKEGGRELTIWDTFSSTPGTFILLLWLNMLSSYRHEIMLIDCQCTIVLYNVLG